MVPSINIDYLFLLTVKKFKAYNKINTLIIGCQLQNKGCQLIREFVCRMLEIWKIKYRKKNKKTPKAILIFKSDATTKN